MISPSVHAAGSGAGDHRIEQDLLSASFHHLIWQSWQEVARKVMRGK